MPNKPIVKQNSGQLKANAVESLKDFSTSTVKNVGSSFKDLGTGMLDQFFGGFEDDDDNEVTMGKEFSPPSKEQKVSPKSKKEANIFNYNEYHESVLVKKEIRQLGEQISKEIQYIRKADKSLLNEVQRNCSSGAVIHTHAGNRTICTTLFPLLIGRLISRRRICRFATASRCRTKASKCQPWING